MYVLWYFAVRTYGHLHALYCTVRRSNFSDMRHGGDSIVFLPMDFVIYTTGRPAGGLAAIVTRYMFQIVLKLLNLLSCTS